MEKRVKMEIFINDVDRLAFQNQKQLDAFKEALGYISWYSLRYDTSTEESEVKVIILGKDTSNLEILSNFNGGQTEKGGFTLVGISERNGTEYSFHS